MAKTWILDTETKGTGAHVVPLEKALRKPEPRGERLYVPPKRAPRPPKAPEPRQPRSFKIVDVTTREVLGEGVDARTAIALLEDVDSVVDVRIYVWDPGADRWVLLTLGEQNALWEYRGRTATR
ncbi:MAG TPA: hypothetical protein VF257_09770 [Solirubrobacteraceae bacterium]